MFVKLYVKLSFLRGLREIRRDRDGVVCRTFIKSCSKYIKRLTSLTLTYIKTVDKKTLEVALFFILLLRWTDETLLVYPEVH